MRHIMFDIDGTLLHSFALDEACYIDAVRTVLGQDIDLNWQCYTHVTDAGILTQLLREKGLIKDAEQIHHRVKQSFVNNIRHRLSTVVLEQVASANEFIHYLKQRSDVSLSIATGGWLESARLKLQAAGIEIDGIPISSSNDHYARTEIMRIALAKAGASNSSKVTYFGDAPWDQQACRALGFDFVLVGGRFDHTPSIDDFSNLDLAIAVAGLNNSGV